MKKLIYKQNIIGFPVSKFKVNGDKNKTKEWKADIIRQTQNGIDLLKGECKLRLSGFLLRAYNPAYAAKQSEMIDSAISLKPKTTPFLDSLLVVDPAGLAPTSSGTNTDMLLYTPRARATAPIIQRKRPLCEGLSRVPDFGP